MGLPASLETVLSSGNISDPLWRNISEVQSRGGTMYLNNLMQNLTKLPGEIKNRIEQSENLIKNEDAEVPKIKNSGNNMAQNVIEGKVQILMVITSIP